MFFLENKGFCLSGEKNQGVQLERKKKLTLVFPLKITRQREVISPPVNYSQYWYILSVTLEQSRDVSFVVEVYLEGCRFLWKSRHGHYGPGYGHY